MMSSKQDPCRRQIQGRHVSVGSVAKRKRSQVDVSQAGERLRYSGSSLPEDIWRHICSFLPLKDAARAASVSHSFKRFWRCQPNLNFSKKTMGYKKNARRRRITTRDYNSRVDHILRNHLGTGVKTLRLKLYDLYNADTRNCLDSWLQIAVTPGIEELSLILSNIDHLSNEAIYEFPCSLLSNGSGNTIRELDLLGCAFRPTVGIGCTGSLTSLCLSCVNIESDELGFLLSNSLALERLELKDCSEIFSIKIPSLLQRLSYLMVSGCSMLQVIESEAPNISSFHFFHDDDVFYDDDVDRQVQLFLGESLRMKEIFISHSCVLHYALAVLTSSMPNLETLTMYSYYEMVSTPTLASKFLHLKYLNISVFGWKFASTPRYADYDLFSLVSCLDASPCLETFNLDAPMRRREHDSIFEDPSSQLVRIPGQCYANLRHVKITKFRSTKLLVKLTCHILDSTPSLECLTLDITDGGPTCSELDRCFVGKQTFMEAPKALAAIQTYIEGKVPSTAKLNVVEPCSRCPAL
ncbi:unnamed protein product [Triticum turgidum subsp. durum]|uniref:F-box domain-containing protein n=1 Tax=Triticum turgidum subsp. durum TaxID=4567 RepID=A0A9R0XCR2_TRITD|nr:unnamed protein product [Triticum turgidum subsp. durum]